jgi:hypothetical protein
LSPCGWYRFIVSPTIPAHLLVEPPGVRPRSSIAVRIRRCDGFRPSRTSGKARLMITDIA